MDFMLYQIIYLIIVVAVILLALRFGLMILLFALLGFLAGFVYNLIAPHIGAPLLPIHNFWILVLAGGVVWLFVR